MNITVIGSGYVGLVTGACLADLGNQVFCLDVDESKIAMLNRGELPIYEPGLKEIVERNVEAGRLRFSTDVCASVQHGDVQFIAVGTPPDEDGSADLKYVLSAARAIAVHMRRFTVIVNKSTVPVGTGALVHAEISAQLAAREMQQLGFSVVSNPEFLKEGAAVADFSRPDRIVLGVAADEHGQKALAWMRQLYAPFNRNHERTRVMDVKSAELTKYAANAMLATRISFMNELANLADRVGADIELVRQGIGSDSRIGHSFLYAGAGYGGSCFPKDVRALVKTGQDHGIDFRIVAAVSEVNERQKHLLSDKVAAYFGRDLRGRRFAVWGLAFKPNTDDMREAPSRTIVVNLLKAGATVIAHDPVASEEAQVLLTKDLADAPDLLSRLMFASKPLDALADVDALLVITEWKVYHSPNFPVMRKLMKSLLIFDGRNIYDPDALAREGFTHFGIGRGNSSQWPRMGGDSTSPDKEPACVS